MSCTFQPPFYFKLCCAGAPTDSGADVPSWRKHPRASVVSKVWLWELEGTISISPDLLHQIKELVVKDINCIYASSAVVYQAFALVVNPSLDAAKSLHGPGRGS